MSKLNSLKRKIYLVVREYDCEGSEVQGVFVSKKKAEKFSSTFEDTLVAHSRVEEWEIQE